jgi:streptomycin 6-kinase
MQFKKNILSSYGQEGQVWLDNLPLLTQKLAEQWGLSQLQVMPNLSCNYVVRGVQADVPVVLKIGFYTTGMQYEAKALRSFAGNGCVKLLDMDLGQGALLLQCVLPGTPLKALFLDNERQAAEATSSVIKKLQLSTNHQQGFPLVKDWLMILDKNWDVPQQYLEKARILKTHLLATTTQTVLLHGDLHNENILACGDTSWIAIDPKGVIGDPVFEVGAAIYDPIPDMVSQDVAQKIMCDRIDWFAQLLNYDRQRIYDWAFVQTVLRACWALEWGIQDEQDNAAYFLNMAENLMTWTK